MISGGCALTEVTLRASRRLGTVFVQLMLFGVFAVFWLALLHMAYEVSATNWVAAAGLGLVGLVMLAVTLLQLWSLSRLIARRGAVIEIDARGLRDWRLSDDLIPWDGLRWEITLASKLLIPTVTIETPAPLRLHPWQRLFLKQPTPLRFQMPTAGLDCTRAQLEAALTHYAGDAAQGQV